MKIKKSLVEQIIKEEALKIKRVMVLKEEKNQILKQLNELYEEQTLEEGVSRDKALAIIQKHPMKNKAYQSFLQSNPEKAEAYINFFMQNPNANYPIWDDVKKVFYNKESYATHSGAKATSGPGQYTAESARHNLRETGEWDDSDEEMMSQKEYLKSEISKITKRFPGKVQLISVKGFDKYQGPYAVVKIKNSNYKVWLYEVMGFGGLVIEDFPVDNSSKFDNNPGFTGSVDEIIGMLKKYFNTAESTDSNVDALDEKFLGMGTDWNNDEEVKQKFYDFWDKKMQTPEFKKFKKPAWASPEGGQFGEKAIDAVKNLKSFDIKFNPNTGEFTRRKMGAGFGGQNIVGSVGGY